MQIEFSGEIIYWKGPAPFHFISVPANESSQIKSVASMVTYGWGMVYVYARIGDTKFKTTLFPKDGKYLLPIKADVRKAEGLELGAIVKVELEIKL